ncbi:hypothetical protein JTE90_007426 [Oedothorax gibbosus]|uniref:Uncharacterized protein n=1 Tax=Oedothorax gibbosus TaxID=931172 RepID=A0AAV6UPC7_9ARAC|nr:hypothetical protein JTE90_007426 [Oedothorax gibbosus]
MPGSLRFPMDAYSDMSSARSLDSKPGAKKVSFNKSVRVKQYPSKPDFVDSSVEHLTLPSDRFWFKVHKNKYEQQDFINPTEEAFKSNTWNEDDFENIRDSLAPIAEVEDLDLDLSNMKSKTTLENIHHDTMPHNKNSNLVNVFNIVSRPIEPPPDYLDDVKYASNHNYNIRKNILESKKGNENNYGKSKNSNVFNKDILNPSPYCLRILEDSDKNAENQFTDRVPFASRLQQSITRDSSPFRQSIESNETSDFFKKRKKRSRSYDDHLDNRFQLSKADKSVSTEDLNSSHGSSCFTNSLLRGSRDMATQCYGTLTRYQNPYNGTSQQTSEEVRLNNFKSSATLRKSFGVGSSLKTSRVIQLKKENQGKELSEFSSPYDYHTKPDSSFNKKILNFKKQEQSLNGKQNDSINKPLMQNNSVSNRVHDKSDSPYKAQIKNSDFQSKLSLKGYPRNLRENDKTKTFSDSIILGHLRGQQIPLREMNTNTHYNLKDTKDKTTFARDLYRTENKSPFPPQSTKPDSALTSEFRSKRDLSSNQENRNHKGVSSSANSYPNGSGNSMIDWSLSGFQLAPKPDTRMSSVSDSESTAYKRPPLLMYIPGVSHHDRPAIEDDRLSHLSDRSQSDSSYLRRQNSLHRDIKPKWLKWKR